MAKHHMPKAKRRHFSEPRVLIPQSMKDSLRCHDFFRVLPAATLEELILGMRIMRCAPGDTLIQENTTGQCLFLLLKGKVEVQSDRCESTLAILRDGAFFGEIGAFYDVQRTATIRARDYCTVAVIPRLLMMKVLLKDETAFKNVLQVAQARYAQVKPPSKPTGHVGEPHYLRSTIRHRFPRFESVADAEIDDLVVLCPFRMEAKGTLMAFQTLNPFEEDIQLMILSGSIQMVDPVTGRSVAFLPGDVAAFEATDHFLSYMVSTEDTGVLVIPSVAYDRLVGGHSLATLLSKGLANSGGKPFPQIPTNDTVDRTLVNDLEGNMGGATTVRRLSATAIFNHNQVIPRALPPLQEVIHRKESIELVSDMDSKLSFETTGNTESDTIIMISLLTAHGIHPVDDVHMDQLMPRFTAEEINFSSMARLLTDKLLFETVHLFGQQILSLNLSGSMISDAGFATVAQGCPNIIRLNISNCVLLTRTGLVEALNQGVFKGLSAFIAAHIPSIATESLQALDRYKLTELDVSFCRNLTPDSLGVIMQSQGETLEKLSLRRMVALSEEALLSLEELNFKSAALPHLAFLDLSDCAFLSTNGLGEILRHTPQLESLCLNFCSGLDEDLGRALTHLEDAPLKNLDLSYCPRAATDPTLKALRFCTPQLEALSLRGCRHITIDSLELLRRLPNLKVLNASDCCNLDDAVLEDAAASANWKLLTKESLFI